MGFHVATQAKLSLCTTTPAQDSILQNGTELQLHGKRPKQQLQMALVYRYVLVCRNTLAGATWPQPT